MVQSPSWEANWFAASQEIPRISRNPKVHYHYSLEKWLWLWLFLPMPTLLPIYFYSQTQRVNPFTLNQFYELHTMESEFDPAQNQVSVSQILAKKKST